jgi:glycosyltransferase involved in cell wall biosynthesis
LSASGWDTLIRWLRSTEEISGEWLDHAVQSNAGTHAGGLNLIGHFRLPCGVGEEIARFADGLEQLDIPISRRDVPTFQLTPPICGIRPLGLENHDITFLKFGATVDLRDAFERTGLYPRPGVYRVAGWSWELDTFPLEATRQLDFVDEIWTPSRFVADGAERIAAGRPVTIMPPAIPVPVIPSHARARFDLDPKAFVIFFAFDAGSVFERKNPFALIQAVRAAFRRDDRATLVLKVSNPTAAAGPMARLRTELNEIGGRLIEGMIPREDVAALLSACDCYASLHRSEGFGFSLAEAMLLGKPIVATGYSGNLDFMSSENSYLVSHRLIELESAVGPYAKGARWAEPNVDHAAELLRQVYEFPDDARQFGLNAKQELEPRFAPSTAARRIVQRLQTIRESRGRTAA